MLTILEQREKGQPLCPGDTQRRKAQQVFLTIQKREGGFLLSFLLPLLYKGKSASSLNVPRLETPRRTKQYYQSYRSKTQEHRFCNDLN